MGSSERPVVEAFLLVDAPSQRLGYWTKALAALDSPDAPPIAEVIAHYDALADQAVLSLRYHASPRDPAPLAFVGDIAMVAEVDLIQFGELSSRERHRFSVERLGRCTLAIDHKRHVVEALQELVRRLRFQRASSPRELSAAADAVPLVRAKGTRDELAATRWSREAPPVPERLPPPERRTNGAPARANGASTRETNGARARANGASTRETNGAPARAPTRETSGAPTAVSAQAQGSPGATQSVPAVADPAAPQGPQEFADSTRIIVDDELRYRVPPPLPRAVRRSTAPPPVGDLDTRTAIFGRYLRSGKWLPTRVASLSLKGATLMSSALPRVDDVVDVALSHAGHRALVRGKVDNVALPNEAAVTGTSTFGLNFDLDPSSRRQLTALLTAARTANVKLKPPPPRSSRRFVVEWPICIGTSRGIIKAEAFDLSLGGMFVRPTVGLELGTVCTFSIVLEDGDTVVTGRARIVRQLDEQSAAACGVSPGFGLSIVDIADFDKWRWESFISRVERRTGKRVLVGAPPARLAKLQATLSAAGYAVMGSGDPGSLVQLANADARPPDAALIDSRWLVNGGLGSWVENVLATRNVPCVRAPGDARSARTSVDELLGINDKGPSKG